MDLIKIGKYIAEKRKALGLTQKQLAEKLNMSDKSVLNGNEAYACRTYQFIWNCAAYLESALMNFLQVKISVLKM